MQPPEAVLERLRLGGDDAGSEPSEDELSDADSFSSEPEQLSDAECALSDVLNDLSTTKRNVLLRLFARLAPGAVRWASAKEYSVDMAECPAGQVRWRGWT